MRAGKKAELRASVLSNYTDPLPDTPRTAGSSSTPLSPASTASTAPLPPTPQAEGSVKPKRTRQTGTASTPDSARSTRSGTSADTSSLPPTPVNNAGHQDGPESNSASQAYSGISGGTRHGGQQRVKGISQAGKAEPSENGLSKGRPRANKKNTPAARTWQHEAARLIALYLVPVTLSMPLSLVLALTRLLLQPTYNSSPLSLHPMAFFGILAVLPSILVCHTARHERPRTAISARICLLVSALGNDLIVVSGRRVGSLAGKLGGPEWGALGAKVVLGLAVVGGGVGFAVQCFDHILSVEARGPAAVNQIIALVRLIPVAGLYVAHIWVGERIWMKLLGNSTSIFVQNPERSILLLSLFLTLLSLFLRSTPPSNSFARSTRHFLQTRLNLTKRSSDTLWSLLSRLPRQIFPILLLLRLPLLIIALRQQIYLRPSPPYLAVNGKMRVLSSERGVTGQIVVGEELTRGFRFLRCDASILGGKWVRTSPLPKTRGGGVRTELGDSIFATFPLQEIGLLAHRADTDQKESVAHTVAMTTGLTVGLEADPDSASQSEKLPDRALMVGLGVGIAAQAFSQQSIEIDLVEIDPLVYQAAVDHFDLVLPPNSTTVNLMDGNEYVSSLAQMRRDGGEGYTGQKWRYVIQDCFSGGTVPDEMFTREFWTDLSENVEQDGIVAMNFVGMLNSRASKAVLVTLLSVFEQCRAFGDPAENHVEEDQSINMVVFCTQGLSPLLTFRKPTPADVRRSPLRSHVYSTSQANEIQLYDVLSPDDWTDLELMLRRGEGRMMREGWQVRSGLSMWYNMQRILTPEMWMTF